MPRTAAALLRTIRAVIVGCALMVLWVPGVAGTAPGDPSSASESVVPGSVVPGSPESVDRGSGLDQSATLTLDPPSGRPGTTVTATLSVVAAIRTVNVAECSEPVLLLWDGADIATFTSLQTTFIVPDGALAGTHLLTVGCTVESTPVEFAGTTFDVEPVDAGGGEVVPPPPPPPTPSPVVTTTPTTTTAASPGGSNHVVLILITAVLALCAAAAAGAAQMWRRAHHRSHHNSPQPTVETVIHADPLPHSTIHDDAAPGETSFAVHVRTHWTPAVTTLEEVPHVNPRHD